MSDRLGLATAKKSLLDYIFRKWGELIRARKLQAAALRNMGLRVRLRDLPLPAVPQGRNPPSQHRQSGPQRSLSDNDGGS
jgi:hypothetical protein